MKAPLDQPYVCKKGHVTEVGWTGEKGTRCRECHLFSKKARRRRYYVLHRESELRYVSNYQRTWGRGNKRAYCRKYHEKHRDERNAKLRQYKAGLVAIGVKRHRGDFTPTMLAKLRTQIERDRSQGGKP